MTQKYTTVNGIRKYNPAWSPPPPTAPSIPVAIPFANQATALPVVSAPVVEATAPPLEGENEIAFVPTSNYSEAVTKYHEETEPEIHLEGYEANSEGGQGGSLDKLNAVLAKYEVPAGMLWKLLEVRQFDIAEIIVDDSGSMGLMTDARDPLNGQPMSRWWEAKHRISQMVELLAYVVSPPIKICFLNRPNVLVLQRNGGELPEAYIQRAEGILIQAFQQGPRGSTPALEAIRASLERDAGKRVLRYFMGDGAPNGGIHAQRQIRDLIKHRPSPEDNPFTFMSCTDDDDQVEWMKTTEEVAPYCAEFDDYHDESREVLGDQGRAFPYSFGMHLVAQIVAAFNPHDLDAMDESVPFTRATLDNLQGYRSSEEEYRYYFDSFREAQLRLPLAPYQRGFVTKLPRLYSQFASAAVAADIPAAAQYKNEMKMKNSLRGGHQNAMSRGAARGARNTGDDCCVVQ